MGLREEKKKQTRKLISDIATCLFFERGYSNVTTAEIAAKAGVSAKTVFNYFPSKEALVFDEDEETERDLISTVVNRANGEDILDALLKAGIANIENVTSGQYADFMGLVQRTPELSLYAQRMWMRHERALASAIRKESKKRLGEQEARAIARFVLDSYHRAMSTPHPAANLKAMFGVLREGWSG